MYQLRANVNSLVPICETPLLNKNKTLLRMDNLLSLSKTEEQNIYPLLCLTLREAPFLQDFKKFFTLIVLWLSGCMKKDQTQQSASASDWSVSRTAGSAPSGGLSAPMIKHIVQILFSRPRPLIPRRAARPAPAARRISGRWRSRNNARGCHFSGRYR